MLYMEQAINLETIHKNVLDLKDEVRSLRTLVSSVIADDKEGDYKPEFVADVLHDADKTPEYEYKNKGDLLNQIKAA